MKNITANKPLNISLIEEVDTDGWKKKIIFTQNTLVYYYYTLEYMVWPINIFVLDTRSPASLRKKNIFTSGLIIST